MPRRISNRPADINQVAFLQVERSTRDTEEQPTSKPPKVTKSEISRIMSAMGKKGGKIGGKISAANLSPEQRRARALQAARARWAKKH